MKAVLAGLVAFSTALSCTTMARGEIRARAFVSISGVDTQGVFLPPINQVVDQTNAMSSDTGDLEITGGTDIGTAVVTATAFGGHAK